MIKKKMPFRIRKRLLIRKSMEEYLKLKAHNLRQLYYLRHDNPELLKDQDKDQSR